VKLMARGSTSPRKAEPAPRGVVELKAVESSLPLRTIARYAAYGLLLVLAGALAGWLVGGLGPTRHGARAEVLYQLESEQATGFLRQDRQLSTQLVALRSRAVLEPVAAAHDMRFEDLADRLHVAVVESSEVIRIEVHDRSAGRARDLAAGVAGEYLDRFRPEGTEEAQTYLEGQLQALDDRREAVRARLEELEQARLGGVSFADAPPASAEEIRLQAENESILEERDQLRDRLDQVTVEALRAPRVDLIADAFVLDDPVAPRPERGAAGGAAAGFLVAVALVAFLVWRRSSEPRLR
jgi:hypothetical protein